MFMYILYNIKGFNITAKCVMRVWVIRAADVYCILFENVMRFRHGN